MTVTPVTQKPGKEKQQADLVNFAGIRGEPKGWTQRKSSYQLLNVGCYWDRTDIVQLTVLIENFFIGIEM